MAAIKVNEATLKKVKKIAKKQHFNNGDFVEKAADFFIKTDLDLDADYSIKSEINTTNKRLNQVIAFIRKQEDAFIIPVFNELRNNNELTKDYLERLKPGRIEKTFDVISKEFSALKNNIEASNQRSLSLENQLKKADEKNSILLGLISLERDFKGRIKDKEREQSLLNRLDNL